MDADPGASGLMDTAAAAEIVIGIWQADGAEKSLHGVVDDE